MRTCISLMLVAIVMIAFACSPIYTGFDYDKDVDFSQFKSYSWLEVEASAATNVAEAQQQSPLAVKRVHTYVDDQLTAKGLKKLDHDGDLFVAYYTSAKEMLEVSQNNYSAAGMWADSRVGGSAKVDETVEGTIIVDLLDAKSKQLVWRGIAEGARDADAPTEQIYQTLEEAIQKLFKEYPPK